MALCLASSESKPPAAGGEEGGGVSAGFAKTPHCYNLRVPELMEKDVVPDSSSLCVPRYTLCSV